MLEEEDEEEAEDLFCFGFFFFLNQILKQRQAWRWCCHNPSLLVPGPRREYEHKEKHPLRIFNATHGGPFCPREGHRFHSDDSLICPLVVYPAAANPPSCRSTQTLTDYTHFSTNEISERFMQIMRSLCIIITAPGHTNKSISRLSKVQTPLHFHAPITICWYWLNMSPKRGPPPDVSHEK